ncbi:MAG: cadherin-like domain-containing protein, partial [Candidatus Eremiobacteraeota bacterium]|nr:cadherin-like domain-containing protein [Candidatus Eremiobacteraeota bacterium]
MKIKRYLLLAAAGAFLNFGISGCGNSEEFVFTQGGAINPNVAPVANSDIYPSVGNAPLSISAARGVFANDELNGGGIASFDTTATAGSVQLADDGSFTYEPPFGFTGRDTFTYTLSNSAGESTTTVTVQIENLAFFVDNTAPDGGNGSFNSRFNQMTQATAASGPNDFIAVFRGDGTSNGLAGPIELKDGQKLIGEGSGFTAEASLLLQSDQVSPQSILPAGNPAVLTGPILLADGNLVAGFQIDGSNADGIFGDSVDGATIENNEFLNYTESAVDFLNSSGSLQVLRCTFHQVAMRDGVTLNNTNTNADLVINENIFTDDGAETRSCADINVLDANSTLNFTCNNNRVLFESELWFRGFLLTSNGTSTFRADGNNIQGDGISGILAATLESTGNIDLTWTNNSLIGGKELGVTVLDGSQVTGEIRGNTVDTDGELGQEGIDITLADDRVDGEGSSATLTITENMLTGAESGHDNSSDLGDLECGITVQARSNSVFDSTIEGNVISGWRHGIWFIGEGLLFSEVSILNNNISNAE